MTRNLILSSLLLSCIGITACSDDNNPDELSPEQIAENERFIKEWRANKAKEEALKKSIIEADEKTLKKMLSDCRTSVQEHARSMNKGPFANHMIDKYSADMYQYSAGPKALKTDEERIAEFKEAPGYNTLNTEYAILSAFDTFGGAKKIVDKYKCEFKEGPAVKLVTKAY